MHFDSGSGETVIFVHGIASTHATWDAVIAPLSEHFRCVAYDLPGHGATDCQSVALTLEALVEELERLRQKLKLDEIRLVGHSLGALIAAGYALKYTSRVKALVLLAAPAGRTEVDRQTGAKLIEAMKVEGVRQVLPRLIDSWYTPDFVKSHHDALETRLKQIYSIKDAVMIGAYELYYETDIAPWLDKLTIPTLVMTGRDARGCGADVARFIANRLPRASLVILEGQRNGILTEVPPRVVAEVVRFFRHARSQEPGP